LGGWRHSLWLTPLYLHFIFFNKNKRWEVCLVTGARARSVLTHSKHSFICCCFAQIPSNFQAQAEQEASESVGEGAEERAGEGKSREETNERKVGEETKPVQEAGGGSKEAARRGTGETVHNDPCLFLFVCRRN